MRTPIDRLTSLDRLMLTVSRRWPQDIGALAVLDGRCLADPTAEVRIRMVRDAIASRLHLVPRLRQVPTLVLAGRDDFIFPPEHLIELAAGIPGARLEIIDRAGHNPHDERTGEVMRAVTDFVSAGAGTGSGR